jgi:hypothetical protein
MLANAICSRCYMLALLYARVAICSRCYMLALLYARVAICSRCYMLALLYANNGNKKIDYTIYLFEYI